MISYKPTGGSKSGLRRRRFGKRWLIRNRKRTRIDRGNLDPERSACGLRGRGPEKGMRNPVKVDRRQSACGRKGPTNAGVGSRAYSREDRTGLSRITAVKFKLFIYVTVYFGGHGKTTITNTPNRRIDFPPLSWKGLHKLQWECFRVRSKCNQNFLNA